MTILFGEDSIGSTPGSTRSTATTIARPKNVGGDFDDAGEGRRVADRSDGLGGVSAVNPKMLRSTKRFQQGDDTTAEMDHRVAVRADDRDIIDVRRAESRLASGFR